MAHVPRRPPGLGDHRSDFDWQEALIEEARRRARRRRQHYAALTFGSLAVAVLVGFTGISGGHPRDLSDASAPLGTSAASASSGKVAFADDVGRLQVVAPDASRPEVIAHCPAVPHRRLQRGFQPPSACELVQPAWSPDGRQLAFVRGDSGYRLALAAAAAATRSGGRVKAVDSSSFPSTLSLYLRDTDGTVRRLADCGTCGRQWGGRLSWSPDSSAIAFSREGEQPWTLSLWVVETASGKPRRLTECQACADVRPAWAPSGQLIAFNRQANGGSRLYTVRADGSHLTKINESTLAGYLQWSPDGRQIAFDNNNDIFIANADGSDQRRLVGGEPGNGPGVPSWSPDGTKLAYFNTPAWRWGFTAEVWTMNTDGSQKLRLYHSACCIESWAPPIWSPDGKKVAFATDAAAPPIFSPDEKKLAAATDWAGGTFVVDSDGTNLRRLSTASANGITWQRLP